MKTTKRVLAILLAVLLLALSVPFAFAEDSVEIGGQCGKNAFWKLDDQGKLTIFGEGEVTGFSMESNLKDCVKTVEVQSGITDMESLSFAYYYHNLVDVSISDSVEKVSNNLECQFISVDEGNPFFSSEDGVLYNKEKTTLIRYPIFNERESFTVPESVRIIGDASFCNCDNLRNLVLPNGITEIQDFAFSACDRINMNLPEQLTRIGVGAFGGCWFETVSISKNVQEIGEQAFSDCWRIQYFDVDPDNAYYSSDEGVLYNKEKTVLLKYPPQRVETSYWMPDTVEVIHAGAFNGASTLEEIHLASGITRIEAATFESCRKLKEITIPDGVTFIGSYAFFLCEDLIELRIPSSVMEISEAAIYYCDSLERIIVDPNNPHYSSDEHGVLYNKQKTKLIAYPIGSIAESFDVPASVEEIADHAFYSGDYLVSVTLPDGVRRIGYEAFSYCSKISEIVLPETLTEIQSNAFSFCNDLQIVQIPQGITVINPWVFEIENLEKVYLPFGLQLIDNNAFSACINLTDVYFAGSEAEWNQIEIKENNEPLLSSNVHFCNHEKITPVPAVDATCASFGYTAGERCDLCGRWLSGHKKIVIRHTDEDNDGVCDLCGQSALELVAGETKTISCSNNTPMYRFVPEEDGYYRFESSYSFNDVLGTLYDEDNQYVAGGSGGLVDGHTTRYAVDFSTHLSAGEIYYLSVRFVGEETPPAGYTEDLDITVTKELRGDCGNHLIWAVDNEFDFENNYYNLLSINGSGDMWDYSDEPAPWSEIDGIKVLMFGDGVGTINPAAFADMQGIRIIQNYSRTLITASVFQEITEGFTVWCYNNSAEHRYCKENGIPYKLFDVETESLQDDDTGVEIAYLPEAFDTDVSLNVETLDAQNENARAWEIKPVDEEGNIVQPNQPVQIRLPLPAGWKKLPLLVTHIHDDGETEIIRNYQIEGEYVTFWVSRFSEFTVAIQKEVPHEHTYGEGVVTTEPTCSEDGVITYTCVEGDDSYTESIPALGHIDEDNDGYCDRCEEMMVGDDHCPQCGKIHNGGFFDKIVGFFHKIIYRLTHLFKR